MSWHTDGALRERIPVGQRSRRADVTKETKKSNRERRNYDKKLYRTIRARLAQMSPSTSDRSLVSICPQLR